MFGCSQRRGTVVIKIARMIYTVWQQFVMADYDIYSRTKNLGNFQDCNTYMVRAKDKSTMTSASIRDHDQPFMDFSYAFLCFRYARHRWFNLQIHQIVENWNRLPREVSRNNGTSDQ